MADTIEYRGENIEQTDDGKYHVLNKVFWSLAAAKAAIDVYASSEAVKSTLGTDDSHSTASSSSGEDTFNSQMANFYKGLNQFIAIVSVLALVIFIIALISEFTEYTPDDEDIYFYLFGIFSSSALFISCAAISVLINIMDTNRLIVSGQDKLLQAISDLKSGQ